MEAGEAGDLDQKRLAVLRAEELDRGAVRIEDPQRPDAAVEGLRVGHEVTGAVPVAGDTCLGEGRGHAGDVQLEHGDVGLLEGRSVAPLAAGELRRALGDLVPDVAVVLPALAPLLRHALDAEGSKDRIEY